MHQYGLTETESTSINDPVTDLQRVQLAIALGLSGEINLEEVSTLDIVTFAFDNLKLPEPLWDKIAQIPTNIQTVTWCEEYAKSMGICRFTTRPEHLDMPYHFRTNRYNCFGLTMMYAKGLVQYGIPIDQIRTFNFGGHIGLIFYIEEQPEYVVYNPQGSRYTVLDKADTLSEFDTEINAFAKTIFSDNPQPRNQLLLGDFMEFMGMSFDIDRHHKTPISVNKLYPGLTASASLLTALYMFDESSESSLKDQLNAAKNALTYYKIANFYDPDNLRSVEGIDDCEEILK